VEGTNVEDLNPVRLVVLNGVCKCCLLESAIGTILSTLQATVLMIAFVKAGPIETFLVTFNPTYTAVCIVFPSII